MAETPNGSPPAGEGRKGTFLWMGRRGWTAILFLLLLAVTGVLWMQKKDIEGTLDNLKSERERLGMLNKESSAGPLSPNPANAQSGTSPEQQKPVDTDLSARLNRIDGRLDMVERSIAFNHGQVMKELGVIQEQNRETQECLGCKDKKKVRRHAVSKKRSSRYAGAAPVRVPEGKCPGCGFWNPIDQPHQPAPGQVSARFY